MALPAKQMRYTFADCLIQKEEEHIEIIHGEVFLMATPSRLHQEIAGELFRQLANFLEGKQCKAYPAPFGVRLFEQEGDKPDENGSFHIYEDYGQEEVAKVNVLEGCFIDLGKVFSE